MVGAALLYGFETVPLPRKLEKKTEVEEMRKVDILKNEKIHETLGEEPMLRSGDCSGLDM